jgi:prophage antirepressor-like protein
MLTRIKNELFSVADWDFEIFQDEQGNYSFHGATVCDYFEIKNPTVAIQRHIDEEWRFKAPVEFGKGSNAWMIREPGLYQLAMIARTPLAKTFQKWVYSEVLPKLRAEGGYLMPTATQQQTQALMDQLQVRLSVLEGNSRKVLGSSGSAYMTARLFAEKIKLRDPEVKPKPSDGDSLAGCLKEKWWSYFTDGFMNPASVENQQFRWLCKQIGYEPKMVVPDFGLISHCASKAQFPIWLMVWYLENFFVPWRSSAGKKTEYQSAFVDANRINLDDIILPSWDDFTKHNPSL